MKTYKELWSKKCSEYNELFKELCATRRALWLARAERAKAHAVAQFHIARRYEVKKEKTIMNCYDNDSKKWEKVEQLCRAKAEGVQMMDKLVLDACCGSKMFWFDKNDSRVIYIDCRQEKNLTIWQGKSGVRTIDIMPDIVADFRDLPFADESFCHVVFDPPHLVRAGDNSWMKKKYGELPKDWKSLISNGFNECWRVLKVNGTLFFKWNETRIPVSEVISAIGRKPLYGNRCGRQNKTHWMAFFKEADK